MRVVSEWYFLLRMWCSEVKWKVINDNHFCLALSFHLRSVKVASAVFLEPLKPHPAEMKQEPKSKPTVTQLTRCAHDKFDAFNDTSATMLEYINLKKMYIFTLPVHKNSDQLICPNKSATWPHPKIMVSYKIKVWVKACLEGVEGHIS